jgi:hypothetical protein
MRVTISSIDPKKTKMIIDQSLIEGAIADLHCLSTSVRLTPDLNLQDEYSRNLRANVDALSQELTRLINKISARKAYYASKGYAPRYADRNLGSQDLISS